MTWEDCAAAGMTVRQAAEAMGKSKAAATNYAKAHGFRFVNSLPEDDRRRASKSAEMRDRWADPSSRAALRKSIASGLVGRSFRHLMSDQERREYDKLKRLGIARKDALRAIGRADLVERLR